MKTLNLVSDRFGSNKKDAKEVRSFSQFYYTLTADYVKSGGLGNVLTVEKIKSGYDLWVEIYGHLPNGNKVWNCIPCHLFFWSDSSVKD